ncbi:MAG: hypothetical protein B7Z66_13450 [Chromatiales bacterium 21-64-14]|nr:MAG: hypothetical protein B7Z66_13450 [Chromatiales bacterium 21-64-14]
MCVMRKFQHRGSFLVAVIILGAGGPVTAAPSRPSPAPAKQHQLTPDQLVQVVLARNPGIGAMESAVAAATARIRRAGAYDDPMISYAAAPNTAGTPGRGLNQIVQVSQTFPWPGTLSLRSRAASADARSTEHQLADLRLRLAAQARAAYAQWYYVHQALAINTHEQILLARLKDVAETAYSAGLAPEQDVLQAEVERTQLQNQALELDRRRQTVGAAINGLMDQDPDAPLPPPGTPPQHKLPALETLRSAALARYPRLKSLEARIHADQDRLQLAHKGYYPNFKVSTGYNSLWSNPDQRFLVGLSINLPFGANHSGQLDEANAHLRETQDNLRDARIRLVTDLDQAYAGARQDVRTVGLYTARLIPLSRQNLRAAEADYRSGHGDFLKLITAEQQYLMARLELARARADLYTQLASIDYQTAGAIFARRSSSSLEGPAP